jgi:hypothetical protein
MKGIAFFLLLMRLLAGILMGSWMPAGTDSGGMGVQGDRRPVEGGAVAPVRLCFRGRRPAWAARAGV